METLTSPFLFPITCLQALDTARPQHPNPVGVDQTVDPCNLQMYFSQNWCDCFSKDSSPPIQFVDFVVAVGNLHHPAKEFPNIWCPPGKRQKCVQKKKAKCIFGKDFQHY